MLELKEKVLSQEYLLILASMNNLVLVLNRQGKYEEAKLMHRQELKMWEKVLGQEHLLMLASINNLVLVLDSQSKYKEAKQIH